MEAFVGWEAAKVIGKRGQAGPGKGREPCLSLPERRVLKMGGRNGAEDTGEKRTKAGTEVGHSFQCDGTEGRSQPPRLQVGGRRLLSAENVWGGSETCERRFSQSLKSCCGERSNENQEKNWFTSSC